MSWLSIRDAAAISDCSTRTIRRYIHKGKLTSKLSNGLRLVWFQEQVQTVSSSHQTIPKERYMTPLFELYEGLSILRLRFEGPLEMTEWLDRCDPSSPQGHSALPYKLLKFCFDQLDSCFRRVDTLLDDFKLDQTIFLIVYRCLVILKTSAQESSLDRQVDMTESKGKRNAKTSAIFDHLLEQVRTLLLCCAQQYPSARGTETVVLHQQVMATGHASQEQFSDEQAFQQPSTVPSPIPHKPKKETPKHDPDSGRIHHESEKTRDTTNTHNADERH